MQSHGKKARKPGYLCCTNKLGLQVTSIDFSTKMLAKARSKVPPLGLR